MPGIPINELATLDRPMENNDLNTYFPVVYTNGITYKSTINKIFFDGAVKTNVISDSAVTNIKISDNAITSTKISNNSITTNKINNDAITSEKLNSQAGSEAVTADVIRNGAITTAKLDNTIGSQAVTTDVIRNGAITTAKLNTTSFEQAVSTETIRNCAVTTDKLNRAVGNEAVTTDTIRAGAVTPSKTSFLNNNISINDTNILISNGIKFNSVTPTGNICVKNTGEISIKPGAVTCSEIAANAVTTDKILNGSVTAAKLSQASVGTGNICNNAVGTSQLADNSVTTSILNKTANNQAVTTDTIRDAAVTSSKIATGAVITEGISDYNVTTVKIQDGGVTTRKIATGAIGSNEIASGAVIGSKIPDNTIDNNKINNSCNYTINGLTITSPNLGINNVGYKFPSSATDGRFLQHTSGGNLEWVLPSNFEPQAGAVVLNKVLPVGAILPYSSTTLPEDGKFLPCDGTERLISDFPELAAILGNTYGNSSSSGTFKLPNLNGRVPIGNGTGNDDTDSCAFTLGTSSVYGGKYNHQLNIAEMPKHNHNLTTACIYSHHDNPPTKPANYLVASCCGGASSNIAMTPFGSTAGYILSTGDNQPHNNIQPYTVTKYIIKAIPDEVIQYNMNVGPGLSALNASGGQTASIDLSSTEIGLKVTDDFQFDGSGRLELAPLEKSLSIIDIAFDTLTSETILNNLGLSGLQPYGYYAPNGGQYPLSVINEVLPIPCSQFFPDFSNQNGNSRVLYAWGLANLYRPWFQYKFTPTRIGKILGSISLPGRGLPETGPNLVVSDITDTVATTLAYEMIENTSGGSSGSTHRTLFTVDIDESQIGVERTIVFSIVSPSGFTNNWFVSPAYPPQTSTNVTNYTTYPTSLPSNKITAINNSLLGTQNPQVRLMMYYIAGPGV